MNIKRASSSQIERKVSNNIVGEIEKQLEHRLVSKKKYLPNYYFLFYF